MTTKGARRGFAAALASLAVPAVIALPVANAHPPADPCNPATVTAVTNSINGYLNRHPDVNQSLIDIDNQSPGNASSAYLGYFADHPDVANELRALKGPLNDLQCVNKSLPPQIVNALLAL